MPECSCSYCYHNVCFHPARGDGAGLGMLCDGCQFDLDSTIYTGLAFDVQRDEAQSDETSGALDDIALEVKQEE